MGGVLCVCYFCSFNNKCPSYLTGAENHQPKQTLQSCQKGKIMSEQFQKHFNQNLVQM